MSTARSTVHETALDGIPGPSRCAICPPALTVLRSFVHFSPYTAACAQIRQPAQPAAVVCSGKNAQTHMARNQWATVGPPHQR